jgi:outer membrane protein TolC
MNPPATPRRSLLFHWMLGVGCWVFGVGSVAAPADEPINLAAVMRLAGADNLDIQIAQARLTEAQAIHRQTLAQFFPYLTPGLVFRKHEGNSQTVEGEIIEADKQSLAAGVNVIAQLEIGETIYKSLITRHLATAAEFAAETQRQESVYLAVSGFLDLVHANAATKVALESVNIADDYARQVKQAVDAGLAFKGDQFRAQTQAERNRLILRQTQEQRRVAAARLAVVLRLQPTIDLRPEGGEPAPLKLVESRETLGSLVGNALTNRPELGQSGAEQTAAAKARAAALYGPLIPTLRAEYFQGGLGGGTHDDGPRHFNDSDDFSAGLSWRIGPGGLGDVTRIDSADARLRTAQLTGERLRLEIIRQVVEAHARVQSFTDQLASAHNALAAAEESLKLTRQRQQFGVGEVLENIKAEEDLTRARLDYLTIITEHNRAQFALRRAIGKAMR